MDVPSDVRRLAVDPFGELPTPREVELVELGGAVLSLNPWPGAQTVRPVDVRPADVAASVEASRAVARERGKRVLAWWVTREHDSLGPALEEAGLANADTPGFEAIENGMALTSPPTGQPAEDVRIGPVDTWEDFAATAAVVTAVFQMPEVPEEEMRERYADYMAARDIGVSLFAAIDDQIVGSAYGAFGSAGINLFGASVTPEARGRGCTARSCSRAGISPSSAGHRLSRFRPGACHARSASGWASFPSSRSGSSSTNCPSD